MEREHEQTGSSRDDAAAVDRYEQMLRTASPEVIERMHVEAFEKLTPEQLDLLFERFTANAPSDADRPADADPEAWHDLRPWRRVIDPARSRVR